MYALTRSLESWLMHLRFHFLPFSGAFNLGFVSRETRQASAFSLNREVKNKYPTAV